MSDFTSLSVNKNSTRFAPKVKARPGARRTQNNKDNKDSKESQDISAIQRRKSSISKPIQKDHKSIRSIDTQIEPTINNNEFDQEAPSTPIPTKKNISKVVKKTETIITTTTTTTTAITSSSNTKLKTPIATLDTPKATFNLSDSTTISSKQTTESNNPLNNNDKEESLKKMNEVQQQQQQQQQQPRLKRLPSLTKASAVDSDHKDNNNNSNNNNATITTIKKSKTLDTLKAAMNKSMTKEPTNDNNVPSIKSAAKSKTKTSQPVGKKITTPGSSGSGISFSVPSNNNIKSIPSLPTVPPTIIATPKNNNAKPKKKEQNMMDIENITTQPISATKVRKDNEEENDDDHTDISDDENDDASKKRKLQEIQNKSKNKRMKLRSHRIREKPIVTAAAEFQGSDVDDEEDEEIDNEEEEGLEENDHGERDERDENGDDEMNDKAYRTNKEKVYKEKRKIIPPTTKEKQMSKKKKKATTINTATSTVTKKKSIKKNMKVSDMKILEEINFDPLQPEDLDKPVAFFIQDLQRGIVTKSYRDERILHEEEVAKKSNNEEVAKALQKRREEAEQLNEQKRLQLEQERQKQQQQEKDKRNNGLTESQHALQVRLVDGKIVLDTDSMLIDRREEHEKISHEHMEVVEENSNTRKVNAYTYGKKSKSARWSKAETELFYQLLSQFGTDFEMISKMIPNRSRAQLRLKFIREERADPDKITEHLIRKKQPVNLEKFKSVTGLEFEDVPDHFLDIKII